MGILIGADFVPTNSNQKLFEEADVEQLIGLELCNLFRNSDYRIMNLELPLIDYKNPIDKYGPNLLASTRSINAYKKLNVDIMTLANNHIMDQGEEGLYSTVKTLQDANIQYIGLVGNSFENNQFTCFEFQNKKVGIYTCAEHEFSTLNLWENRANPYIENVTNLHIKYLKEKCDYVIVLYHGGKEYYRYPSPELQERCRSMVSSGANLVICQHSHCIGCEEKYKESTIVYGQGNFLFDISDNHYCKTGLLININSKFEIEYIPIVKKGNTITIAKTNERNKILEEFYERSNKVNDDFVNENYNDFSKEMLDKYIWILSGRETLLFRIINKFSFGKLRKYYLRKKYNRKQLMKIYNCLICEAHKELLIKGLENKLYEK